MRLTLRSWTRTKTTPFSASITCAQIQAIIDGRFKGEAVLWALNCAFADLLRQRGGGDFQIKIAVAAYTELDRASRDDAQTCYARVQEMLSSLRKQGFSSTQSHGR